MGENTVQMGSYSIELSHKEISNQEKESTGDS